MRLTGIIDYTMDNFLCVRGFASMLQLSEISKADEKIQRDLIDDHRGEMENFLSDGRFTFFPEVILGANMCGTEMDKDKINTLRETVRAESKSLKINNIKYVIKRNAVKKENNDLAFDVTQTVATVYKGNIIKNLIMDCQSYTKYRPNETTGGIFVSWRRKEELPTGA